jgi:hypothetical protein
MHDMIDRRARPFGKAMFTRAVALARRCLPALGVQAPPLRSMSTAGERAVLSKSRTDLLGLDYGLEPFKYLD